MSCTLDLGRISGVKIADSGKMWIEPGWGLNQTFYQQVLALQIPSGELT